MLDRLRARFTRPVEERNAGGFTAEVIAARESYITGRRGAAELTATAQGCISLWESGLSMASVEGTSLLTPRMLALIARSLALRGEAVMLIRDRLIPAHDWTVTTRDGFATAYRVSISDAGGGASITALAGEVLHVVIASDVSTPWAGLAPLRRATLTAGMLHAVETALVEVFENAPIGVQVIPMPEMADKERERLERNLRGLRGRASIRTSAKVTAAGGPAPAGDWKPQSLSPNLQGAMTAETLSAARSEICHAFGVLPALLATAATGPAVREAQRHLATWTLQPIAALIAQEAAEKMGGDVTLDVMQPLQAYDAGGRSRALMGVLTALAAAKQGGVTPEELAAAAKFAGVPEA